MFETSAVDTTSKLALHRDLAAAATALVAGERDVVANTANIAALLFWSMPQLNWAGFYFLREPTQLILGPFHGKPACIRIPVGHGVCGTAVAQRRSIIVPDVDAFPGHIACDSASRSELVTPIVVADRVVGVIDLDSPEPGRFDDDDERGMTAIAALIASACEWKGMRIEAA